VDQLWRQKGEARWEKGGWGRRPRLWAIVEGRLLALKRGERLERRRVWGERERDKEGGKAVVSSAPDISWGW